MVAALGADTWLIGPEVCNIPNCWRDIAPDHRCPSGLAETFPQTVSESPWARPTLQIGKFLLVAEWHATIGGARSRRKPAIEEIPAFRRLGLQSCGPELGVKIVEAADQVIEKIEAVLIV